MSDLTVEHIDQILKGIFP